MDLLWQCGKPDLLALCKRRAAVDDGEKLASARPRVTVGFGVNWNSPFGPLRIDIAKALLKQKGDDDKLITFNVGTQF